MWRTNRKKVVTEAQQVPRIAARFCYQDKIYDIVYNGKYNITCNGKTRCGVNSLSVAVDYLKKNFPGIEEVKYIEDNNE